MLASEIKQTVGCTPPQTHHIHPRPYLSPEYILDMVIENLPSKPLPTYVKYLSDKHYTTLCIYSE